MSYLEIGDYGVIGDMRTVALVGRNGSIDWCCLPAFDSPSVFAAILDDVKGGFFRLSPVDVKPGKQIYLPDTNVLLTRTYSRQGMAEVLDFMPIGRESGGETLQQARQIIRIAKAIRGPLSFRMECRPAFDYARQPHELSLGGDGTCAVFKSGSQEFLLKSSRPLRGESGAAFAEFVLQSGEEAQFALRSCDGPATAALREEPIDGAALLAETVHFWRAWAGRNRYKGRWRETVTRSALVLKLMTYLPTGAIVAAPTTSLPEQPGGVRNWDYRYTWVRDAAFTVYSLIRLGYTEEAGAFARFMQERAKEEETENGPLNVLYGIDGRHRLPEETLDHLDGYRGARPVRIGNGAADHFQLDIYGELLDSIYLYDKYGKPLSYDMWTTVERLLDWLTDNWRKDDRSIWEVRGGQRDFTFSKLQCWVAFDRGIRLARKRSFPAGGDRWRVERDNIYRTIMAEGWNAREKTFTQFFGGEAVDAALLMMPLMLFVSPTDPRMLGTIDAVRKHLASDSLVRRYDTETAASDGLPGDEGYFSVCSFWLVEALARAGRADEARLLFEKLLSFANHVGLFSEEIGVEGEQLGNFPQALTHLGLISAAHNLDKLLG